MKRSGSPKKFGQNEAIYGLGEGSPSIVAERRCNEEKRAGSSAQRIRLFGLCLRAVNDERYWRGATGQNHCVEELVLFLRRRALAQPLDHAPLGDRTLAGHPSSTLPPVSGTIVGVANIV